MNEERAILPRRYQNWTGSVYFVDEGCRGICRMPEAGTYPALYRYRYAKGGNGK